MTLTLNIAGYEKIPDNIAIAIYSALWLLLNLICDLQLYTGRQ